MDTELEPDAPSSLQRTETSRVKVAKEKRDVPRMARYQARDNAGRITIKVCCGSPV